MLAVFLGSLAQGQALVMLHVIAGDAGDVNFVELVGDYPRDVRPQRLATRRIAQLNLALFGRAGGRIAPGLNLVEEIPVLEGKRHVGVAGNSLAVDAQAALTT